MWMASGPQKFGDSSRKPKPSHLQNDGGDKPLAGLFVSSIAAAMLSLSGARATDLAVRDAEETPEIGSRGGI